MPAVLLAHDADVFDLLYRLVVKLDEPSVLARIRNILQLIPTDPAILDCLESLTQKAQAEIPKTNSLDRLKKAIPGTSSSPKLKRKFQHENTDVALQSLFTFNDPTMTPFRLLYNLEVSYKILEVSNKT